MNKVYGGRWRVDRSLRGGGQAETFVVTDVTDTAPGPHVLKRLRNPDRLDRFVREVEAVRALRHPNIVRLVDADVEGAKP